MNIIKQNGGDLNWFNAAINGDITLLKANLQCGNLKNIKMFASCRDINIVNIDGNTALMLAIINNHIDIIKFLLSYEMININIINQNGETALLLGFINNNIPIINLLFTKGVKINFKPAGSELYNNRINNILHNIIINDKIDYFILFIEGGLDINRLINNTNYITILMYALKYSRINIIKQILSYPSININSVDIKGNTALFYAVKYNNNNEVIKLLLSYNNINVNIIDKKENTVLILAVSNNNTNTTKELLSHKTINPNLINNINILGETALLVALVNNDNNNNNNDMINLLFLYGAKLNLQIVSSKINIISSSSYNVILNKLVKNIIINSNIDMVKKFIDNGFDINYMIHNNTLLMYAFEYSNIDMIKLLLSYPSVNINTIDNNGNSILLNAIIANNIEVVRLLLVYPSINVNIINNKNNTVLINATINNNVDMVILLLSSKMIEPNLINYVNKNSMNAVLIALYNKNYTIMKLLLSNGATFNLDKFNMDLQILYENILLTEIKNDNIDIIKLFLDNGLNINYIINNITLLMYAIKNSSIKVIKLLLSYPSININTIDNNGNTALLYAIINNNIEVVKQLLLYPSINVNIINNENNTVLILACINDNVRMVILLLSYIKPNLINYVNKNSMNAVLIASYNKNYTIMNLLLSNGATFNLNTFNNELQILYENIVITAVEDDNMDLIKLFLDNGLDNNTLVKNITLFLYAVVENSIKIINLLLSYPNIISNISIINSNGNTALIYAINNEYLDVIKLLFLKGAILILKEEDTPQYKLYINTLNSILPYIIKYNIDILKILIAHGIYYKNTLFMFSMVYNYDLENIEIIINNTDIKNINNLELQYVCKNNLVYILNILIKKNIDINQIIDSDNDYTIIMYSILHSNDNFIYLLLANNANIYYTNKYDKSVLTMAIEYDKPNIISLFQPSTIIKNGHTLEPIPFNKATFKKQITDDLLTFFNINFDLNAINPDGMNSSYDIMKSVFNNTIKIKNISYIIKNTLTIDLNNNITFMDNSIIPSNNTDFKYIDTIGEGSYNKVSKYISNNNDYIFREYKDQNNLFECFYENLKHLILYIIICRYISMIKIIPKPIAMCVYNGVLTKKHNTYIGFISESGKYDFYTYMNKISQRDSLRIFFNIYKDLYNINNIPNMELCFIHNDMKPANVVITSLNFPLLIDFGLSSFKINDISFYEAYYETGKFNNKNILNNRMYSLLCDSIVFLYNMNYYNFSYNIIDDINSIYNIKNFKAIIFKIKTNYGYSFHYSHIYKLLFSDSYKIFIFNKYTYIYKPDDLLKAMHIKPDKVLVYDINIYYDKYIKYKNKYNLLKNQKKI